MKKSVIFSAEKNWHDKHKENLTFGSRIADAVANGMNSWTFIIVQTISLFYR